MAPPTDLSGLADLVEPAPVSWLPQTAGWLALGIAAVAAGIWLFVSWRRRREANRYRVEALRELARLDAALCDDMRRGAALAAVPPLLKRVALAAWPRSEVASLSGAGWVAFLRANAAGVELPEETARLLDDLEYRPPASLAAVSASDAEALVRAARAWIEKHRVPA